MPEYVAGLCQMSGTELAPLESVNIAAADDDEAIRKAVQWRLNSITAVPLDQKTWLQVLRDGKAIHSEEIGRL
jgi:hypothetical protein